jgi:hypothetical protein
MTAMAEQQQQQQLTPGGGGAAAVVPAPKVPGGPGFEPSVDQVQQFQRDGVLVVRGLFTTEEVGLVRNIAKASEPESVIWLSADTHKEDVYNGICHSRRVVSTLSALLDDEVYLYHYKMIMKEAQFAAGSEEDRGNHWVWHQDCAQRSAAPPPPLCDFLPCFGCGSLTPRRCRVCAFRRWLLVQKQRGESEHGQLHDRPGPRHTRQRLPPSAEGLVSPRAPRSRPGR